ncbi:MAG: tripartite tricarboxylate transporter TctB family protein [Devosia sp.]|uniref:tripartite tricarboxylate transporter TctB family protein n=1 Tax=Devosia sp. TaxID=1871048 RepID=UPI0024C61FDA|nr:tripartite tricarboxylate transporter TctB family protein [Devosia sp.]UYN99064.1 MAG: tripartite tricarboxylate transporter TctB family protein [Devosia sp.]
MFVAFGGYFALEASRYDFGTPFRMGPGFMPIVLGAVLIALGIAVAAKGFGKPDEEAAPPWPWRGLVLVLGTVIFFAATIRGLGFVPVVLISGFATAMSSSRNNVLQALVISIGLCLLCYLVFVVGLGLLVPPVGPWLRF